MKCVKGHICQLEKAIEKNNEVFASMHKSFHIDSLSTWRISGITWVKHRKCSIIASLKASTMCHSDLPQNLQLIKCFHPIFSWMKLLGICLNSERHLIATFYGLLTFSFTLASNIASMALMLLDTEKPGKQDRSINSYTFGQIIVIDNLIFVLLVIGIHFMLLCQTLGKWKKLWDTLLDIGTLLDNKMFNRTVFLAILFILVSGIILLRFSANDFICLKFRKSS